MKGAAVFYRDLRIGGTEEYGFAADTSFLMQIPDAIRKCVGFIGYVNSAKQRMLAGTVFFVGYDLHDAGEGFPAFMYFVTAKHIIDKIRDKGADPSVRLNFKDGTARWFETKIGEWLTHPDDDTVDVAVFPVSLPPIITPPGHPLDYRRYPVKSFLNDQVIEKYEIGIGDEVFLTGLFINHYGLRANIPIVRTGNIAAMPEEKVEVKDLGLIDAYLIEARSIGGLSGSPVFAYLGPNRIWKDKDSVGPYQLFYLMGLMHGHFDVKPLPDEVNADTIDKEKVNMGIAIVVPASKILEVLDQPMLKKSRKEQEAAHRKRVKEKNLPTADVGEAEELFTKSAFQNALEQASRRLPETEAEDPDTQKK